MTDPAITAVGHDPLLIGYNYPWAFNKYGLYFGPHQREGEAVAPGPSYLDKWTVYFRRNLQILKEQYGVQVVRIFLMCNMFSWGGVSKSGKWRPPKTLDPKYLVDLHAMFDALQSEEMMVIPSFFDFMVGDVPLRDEGRFRVITDPGLSAVFFNQILEPFVDVGKQYGSTVWAWEVINEPVWLTNIIWPIDKSSHIPVMSREVLNRFLDEAIQRLSTKHVLSTVGHRYFDDLKVLSTGDVHQFHYYPAYKQGVVVPLTDPSQLPQYGSQTRAILGEFGASATHGDPWKELDGRDGAGALERVLERFTAIAAKGYRLAMLWPDDVWDGVETADNLKLSVGAAQGMRAFARRTGRVRL